MNLRDVKLSISFGGDSDRALFTWPPLRAEVEKLSHLHKGPEPFFFPVITLPFTECHVLDLDARAISRMTPAQLEELTYTSDAIVQTDTGRQLVYLRQGAAWSPAASDAQDVNYLTMSEARGFWAMRPRSKYAPYRMRTMVGVVPAGKEWGPGRELAQIWNRLSRLSMIMTIGDDGTWALDPQDAALYPELPARGSLFDSTSLTCPYAS